MGTPQPYVPKSKWRRIILVVRKGLFAGGDGFLVRCQRAQVGNHSRRLFSSQPILRHRRPRRQIVVPKARHQEFDRVLVFPSGQPSDFRRLVGPNRNWNRRLERQRPIPGATFPGSAPLFRCAVYGNRRTWKHFPPDICRVEFAQKAAQSEHAMSRPAPSLQETQRSHELSSVPPRHF
jgi:hypothetical protein